MKGIRCEIYSNRLFENCSNNGISARCTEVTVCGPEFPELSEPDETAPAVVLVRRTIGGHEYLHLEPYQEETSYHYMAGGSFVYTTDGRFREVSQYPLSLHDRRE